MNFVIPSVARNPFRYENPGAKRGLRKRQKELRLMSKKHMGSSIDDFLKDEGIFDEAQA